MVPTVETNRLKVAVCFKEGSVGLLYMTLLCWRGLAGEVSEGFSCGSGEYDQVQKHDEKTMDSGFKNNDRG